MNPIKFLFPVNWSAAVVASSPILNFSDVFSLTARFNPTAFVIMNQLWILSLCSFSTVILVLVFLAAAGWMFEDHVREHGPLSEWSFWDHGFFVFFILLLFVVASVLGTIIAKFATDALYLILANSLGYISHP